jgi:hypothetical protein
MIIDIITTSLELIGAMITVFVKDDRTNDD